MYSVAALVFSLAAMGGCSPPVQERVVDLVVPVTVQPVKRGTIESLLTTTGTLRALKAADLVAEVKGELYFAENDGGDKPVEGTFVAAGQLVAHLESEEWVVGVRLESHRLAVLNAKKNLEDKQALFEEGLGLESDVDASRKSLADAESDYQNALLQLEKTKIIAPISGFLTGLTDTTESTLVAPGTVIGKVVDYSRVLVDLQIPNSQMQSVDLGQQVRITNYAFPDKVFEGRISVLDPTLDPTTRTFRVEAAVDNPERRLRPGMFVKAEVVTEARRDIVVIPRQLVITRQNQKVVFVEEEGRAQMRPIETGIEDDTNVEIVSGLAEGERLITSNYETLRSRTQVRVTGESGPVGPRD
ncbi:MAG: efflux RND transporter periplasmic adaptor subunit [Acidobacteriota bacterium]